MLISHRYKFIYIKTRKTAGSSIEGLLEPFCAPASHEPKHVQGFISSDEGVIAGRAGGETDDDPLPAHASAFKIARFVGQETFDDYLKIYAVRHPYEKVVSWFWYVMPMDIKRELHESSFEATRKLFRTWLLMGPNLPQDRQFYRAQPWGRFPAHLIR